MSLADFQPERLPVKLSGKIAFYVGAISLSDLSVLVRTHLVDMDAIVDLWRNRKEATADNITPFLQNLITQAPGLAANLIALAAGEPTAAPNAEKLPFGVQLQTLSTIVELTFKETGGIKKSLEQVAMLLTMTGQSSSDTTKKATPRTRKKPAQ